MKQKFGVKSQLISINEYLCQTDRVNNNSTGLNNSTLQRQREVATQQEEQKRQLQLEMRRREQELLNKIKEQQKALETMKLEKLKVKP